MSSDSCELFESISLSWAVFYQGTTKNRSPRSTELSLHSQWPLPLPKLSLVKKQKEYMAEKSPHSRPPPPFMEETRLLLTQFRAWGNWVLRLRLLLYLKRNLKASTNRTVRSLVDHVHSFVCCLCLDCFSWTLRHLGSLKFVWHQYNLLAIYKDKLGFNVMLVFNPRIVLFFLLGVR